MSLPTLATIDDFTVRLVDDLDPADSERVHALLVDASALVRAAARKTWVTETEGGDPQLEPVPDEVVSIVCAVARRAYENPHGVTQESTGPFTHSYGPDAAQVLYLTDSERDQLERYHATPGLWTQATTRGDHDTRSIYVDVEGGKPLPVGRDPS